MKPGTRSAGLSAGLLINSASRRNQEHLDEILQIAEACPSVQYQVTHRTEEVPTALQHLADQSVDVLAISGGDGTISSVLTTLLARAPFQTLPLIAILPGGTANMTAGDVGLKGPLPDAMRRLCNWLEMAPDHERVHRRTILRVQSAPNQPARYGFFFGAGAIVQGINYTNDNIHSRGHKSQLSLGVGLLRSMWGIARRDPRFFQPTRIAMGTDGDPCVEHHSVTLMLVTSLERLFLNMRPYWGTPNDKPLHVTAVRDPAKRFLRSLPSLLRGKPKRHMTPEQGYVSYNVETVSLDFDGPFTLDGEIVQTSSHSGPVEISNGAELTFLRI